MSETHHEPTMPDRDMELLPCPFCGGERIGGPYKDEREGLFYAACITSPGTSCGEVYGPTPEAAIARWNRRPLVSPSRGWRLDLENAPRDGTPILAVVTGATGHWQHLNGRAFVIRHEGKTSSGLDLGWSLHPGFGGVNDGWFDRWMPLPALSVAPVVGREEDSSSRSCVEVQGTTALHAETPRFSDVNDLPPGVYENARAVVLLCADPPFRSYDDGRTWSYGPLGVTRAYRLLSAAKLVRTDWPIGTYRRAWPTDDLMEAAQLILDEKREEMEWPSSAEWFGAPSEGSHAAARKAVVPSASTQLRDEKPTNTERGGAE